MNSHVATGVQSVGDGSDKGCKGLAVRLQFYEAVLAETNLRNLLLAIDEKGP